MEIDVKVRNSFLDELARRLVSAVIKEDRISAPLVIIGGGDEDRNYIFNRMQTEFVANGCKVALYAESRLEKEDNRYSIDIGWFVDLIEREGKVPML